MFAISHLTALVLSSLAAIPALAAPADQLRCLDDQLNEQQRAGVASLFAEQPASPMGAVIHPQGSATAAQDLGYALSSCSSQFGWSHAQQDAATQYLIRSGQLARIKIRHNVQWTSGVERIAPFAVAQLESAGQLEQSRAPAAGNNLTTAGAGAEDNSEGAHARAVVLASAMANSSGAVTSDDMNDVIDFLRTWKRMQTAQEAFANIPTALGANGE